MQLPSSRIEVMKFIGQKIDSKAYRLGRHGWEDFAKDIGGVYNFHTRIRYVRTVHVVVYV